MQSTLKQLLSEGSQTLNVTLTEPQITQLITYTMELDKWNKTYNLTAVRTPDEIMKRHVIDALSILNSVREFSPKTVTDIGTGGGVPGIILAILQPELTVYLVESIGKKCRFLRHVVSLLGLSEQVTIIQERVEKWQPNAAIDLIVCRAFTALDNFTALTKHLGNEKSTWMAMKAAQTENEEQRLSKDFKLIKNRSLVVPFESAARHLIIMKKITLEIL